MAENDCQGEDPIALLAEELREEMRRMKVILQDPAAVHRNMLSGNIAKISMVQCAHTHGVQFNDLEAAEAKLSEQVAEILSISQERDRLREALSVAFDNFDELVNWHYGGEWPVEDEKLAALERARAALNKEPLCET